MMDKRSSNPTYNRLMRIGIAAGRVGARTGRGKTASSRAALSFMDWANKLADQEGADAQGEKPTRPLMARRVTTPGAKLNSGKRGASRNRRQSDVEVKNEGKATLPGDPSPANRPVLRIVVDNGRQSVRSKGRKPCLALVK